MTTATTTAPAPVRPRWLLLARVLLALVGTQLLLGATYFTFFAAPEDGGVATGFDWFVAVWALANATALVAVALAPGLPPLRRVELARWAVLSNLLWGLLKLVAYDELVPSLISLTVTSLSLLVLWLTVRPDPGTGHRCPPLPAGQDTRS